MEESLWLALTDNSYENIALDAKYLYIIPDNETVLWLLNDLYKVDEDILKTIIFEFDLARNHIFDPNPPRTRGFPNGPESLSGHAYDAVVKDGGYIFIESEKSELVGTSIPNLYFCPTMLTNSKAENEEIMLRIQQLRELQSNPSLQMFDFNIFRNLASYLSARDVLALCQVSQKFRRFCNSEEAEDLYRSTIKRIYPWFDASDYDADGELRDALKLLSRGYQLWRLEEALGKESASAIAEKNTKFNSVLEIAKLEENLTILRTDGKIYRNQVTGYGMIQVREEFDVPAVSLNHDDFDDHIIGFGENGKLLMRNGIGDTIPTNEKILYVIEMFELNITEVYFYYTDNGVLALAYNFSNDRFKTEHQEDDVVIAIKNHPNGLEGQSIIFVKSDGRVFNWDVYKIYDGDKKPQYNGMIGQICASNVYPKIPLRRLHDNFIIDSLNQVFEAVYENGVVHVHHDDDDDDDDDDEEEVSREETTVILFKYRGKITSDVVKYYPAVRLHPETKILEDLVLTNTGVLQFAEREDKKTTSKQKLKVREIARNVIDVIVVGRVFGDIYYLTKQD